MSASTAGSYAYSDTLKNVFYGPGCLEESLAKLFKTLGVHKAVVVTGKSLRTKVRRIMHPTVFQLP